MTKSRPGGPRPAPATPAVRRYPPGLDIDFAARLVRAPIKRGMWALAVVMATSVCSAPTCGLSPPNAQSPSPSQAVTHSPSPQPTPLAITAPSFHSGEVTVAYAPVALAATGGTPPYTWTIGAGTLPGGLTLSPDGSITGTPSGAGAFDFTAHVADTGARTADLPASISIVAAPTASLTAACAQFCAVEQGCDSTCGTFGTVTGGTAPYGYALQGGYVPHGVSLSGLALAGTFTDPAKFWQFTVLVTDSLGASAAISPIFYVYPHIALASGSCVGNYITGCTVSLPYSGGTPGGTPSVQIVNNGPPDTKGCWPPTGGPGPTGYTLTASGGQVTLTIPKGIPGGYGAVWTLVITDQSQCAAGASCSSSGVKVPIRVQCG
jgi:hypothetical protein